ncbi:stromal membrane-associated protein [Pimephales promelas]|nr:stromal membrane-associated protein [Pimephales promelas]
MVSRFPIRCIFKLFYYPTVLRLSFRFRSVTPIGHIPPLSLYLSTQSPLCCLQPIIVSFHRGWSSIYNDPSEQSESEERPVILSRDVDRKRSEMTTRSEREKAQKLNEQHQAILSKMLREDDNKYCADCEAKGPRWASWNLGVFICIRCAGIHRNLGVHISRVKSVNLDQWTPEQIQSVQSMGNTKARQLYEAHLPENFRRPQTDQTVEFFIRDKYERKKYYDKNAVNGAIKEREKKKEEKKREKDTDKGNKPAVFEKKREDNQTDSRLSPKKSAEPAIDLLGLDAPTASSVSSGAGTGSAVPISDDLDIFGPMVSNPLPSNTNTNQVSSSKAAGSVQASSAGGAVAGATATGSSAPAQGDLDLFSETSGSSKAEEAAKKPLSKDSILSLYGSSTVPQQPAQGTSICPKSHFLIPQRVSDLSEKRLIYKWRFASRVHF